MGSSYFYLEFLLSWLSILSTAGYRNPAIFALEYTLVPDAAFPIQLMEATRAYEHILEFARDPSRVVVSGDSAGATIILSLLMYLAYPTSGKSVSGRSGLALLEKPGMCVLISPWVTLQSSRYKRTTSDYLDAPTLEIYAKRYAGVENVGDEEANNVLHSSLVSPGDCHDGEYWKAASPTHGFFVTYGKEEVFAPEIRHWLNRMQDAKVHATSLGQEGDIHAWPVAALFLCNNIDERLKGLRSIVDEIQRRIPPG